MMNNAPDSAHVTRRTVLEGLGLALGGLVVGLPPSRALAAAQPALSLEPNPFIHIGLDGKVTLVCHRSEMGQGVHSTLPVLLSDELGVDVSQVATVQGDGDAKYGDQNTDGSSSIRKQWEKLRTAAAQARHVLVAAAAAQWRVDPKTCTTESGVVLHRPSGKKLPFKALVAAAAKLPVPEKPELRPRAELKHLGTELPLLDGPDIVTGKAVFAADVKLPGLLTAVVLHPPVVGAKLTSYDATAALQVPGVKQVVELPHPGIGPLGFRPLGGLAVVATDTWSAMRGRARLVAQWQAGDNATYDSQAYKAALSQTVRSPQTKARAVGDVDAALEQAAQRVEAEYHVPHLAHAPMEPPCATARFADGKCEVWACTQNPQAARKEVAKMVGLSEADVAVHVTLLGGGFGRKSKADFPAEAAFIAKAVGAPIRLQWTRDDDIQHDFFHSVASHHLTASLDAKKAVTGWRHRTAFPPIATLFVPLIEKATAQELQQGMLDMPLAIPNVRGEVGAAPAHVRIGWLRSVHNIHQAFAMGSFIDELSHARGVDPKAGLLDVIGPARTVTLDELGIGSLVNYGAPLEEHPIDTGRLRDVIERVTAAAGWEKRHEDLSRGYGLAAYRSFLTYVAAVVAVVKDPKTGKVKVDEAWVCADAGTVVNLERVRSQLEGAVLFGLSLTFFSEITAKGGSVQQTNFRDYRVARMTDAPRRIHVDVVKNERRPGGVGEPGVPPIAPAIANAVFALTGQRLRELPLIHSGLV